LLRAPKIAFVLTRQEGVSDKPRGQATATTTPGPWALPNSCSASALRSSSRPQVVSQRTQRARPRPAPSPTPRGCSPAEPTSRPSWTASATPRSKPPRNTSTHCPTPTKHSPPSNAPEVDAGPSSRCRVLREAPGRPDANGRRPDPHPCLARCHSGRLSSTRSRVPASTSSCASAIASTGNGGPVLTWTAPWAAAVVRSSAA
jgi:hypothetical protein